MFASILRIRKTERSLLPGKAIKKRCNWRGLSGKCQVCCCLSRTKGCVLTRIWQMPGQLLLSLSRHSLKDTSPHDLSMSDSILSNTHVS